MEVAYPNGEKGLAFAPEGIKVGDEISIGQSTEVKMGNVMALRDVPEAYINP